MWTVYTQCTLHTASSSEIHCLYFCVFFNKFSFFEMSKTVKKISKSVWLLETVFDVCV